jgi:siroheme synthase
VVQHAGTARERLCLSTLGSLAADARAQDLGSPAIVIVGDVLRARKALVVPQPRAA